jgi:hypothetical protein
LTSYGAGEKKREEMTKKKRELTGGEAYTLREMHNTIDQLDEILETDGYKLIFELTKRPLFGTSS